VHAIAQVLGGAVQVEPDRLGVRQQVVRVQGVLMGEEPATRPSRTPSPTREVSASRRMPASTATPAFASAKIGTTT